MNALLARVDFGISASPLFAREAPNVLAPYARLASGYFFPDGTQSDVRYALHFEEDGYLMEVRLSRVFILIERPPEGALRETGPVGRLLEVVGSLLKGTNARALGVTLERTLFVPAPEGAESPARLVSGDRAPWERASQILIKGYEESEDGALLSLVHSYRGPEDRAELGLESYVNPGLSLIGDAERGVVVRATASKTPLNSADYSVVRSLERRVDDRTKELVGSLSPHRTGPAR